MARFMFEVREENGFLSSYLSDILAADRMYRGWTHFWDSGTDIFLSKGTSFDNFLWLNYKTYGQETYSIRSLVYSFIPMNYFTFFVSAQKYINSQ